MTSFRGRCAGQETFLRYFLLAALPSMPQALAQSMFSSFDTDDNGTISLDEFLCGLVVLKHGTEEERVLFLFHVLDGDRDGYITQRDVTELAAVLEKAGGRALNPHTTWMEMIHPHNERDEKKIDAARLGLWAGNHRPSPLVRWIFEERCCTHSQPLMRIGMGGGTQAHHGLQPDGYAWRRLP